MKQKNNYRMRLCDAPYKPARRAEIEAALAAITPQF